jgi:outer membrane receptor protein involved in Fe transport
MKSGSLNTPVKTIFMHKVLRYPAFILLVIPAYPSAWSQDEAAEDEVFEMNPFVVETEEDVGYQATHTLGGTRIRTQLEDVAASIQVITGDFLEDTGATDNQSLLQYTTSTEVGGVNGNFGGSGIGQQLNENFTNPSTTTRVRGLAAADNTRNYFRSDIPWDSYIVDRVDIQRGPNAILFGFGSPAGIINTGLIAPFFNEGYKFQSRFDSEGSFRVSADANVEVLEDELAVRVAGLYEDEEYRQEPAFEEDRRYWVGFKYDPKFLRKNGAYTSLNFYFEDGEISANRPRSIVPIDRYSSWFRPVNVVEGDLGSGYNPLGGIGAEFFTPQQMHNDRIPPTPNAGQTRSTYEDGSPNPYYIPAIGAFGFVFGGPAGFIPDAATGQITSTHVLQTREGNGIGPDGLPDGLIDGLYYASAQGVESYGEFSRKAGLPYSEFGLYKNQSITDRSVFDYYNYLLDGPNKEEGQEFDNTNLTLRQTFLHGKLGFEYSHDVQNFYLWGTSLIVDDRQALQLDLNETYVDGTPNPNAGRLFVSDGSQFGNFSTRRERQSDRFTAYAETVLTDYADNALARFFGRQNYTFLLSKEEVNTRNVAWLQRVMGQDYRDFIGEPSIMSNLNTINPVIYFGPSLAGRSSASGLNIQGVQNKLSIPDQLTVRIFDDTWNAPSVNPGESWQHPAGFTSTQSENPANYVGWVDRTFSVEKADHRNPDALARDGSLNRDIVDSQAFVLQNFFLDGSLVGTFGWRRDEVEAYTTIAQIDPLTNRSMVEAMEIADDPLNSWANETKSWSLVGHLNGLPGTRRLMERSPVEVSLYYNESRNFQPNANRIDVFGRSHDPAEGSTEDYSVLLQTKDDRFSLKVTRFENSVQNASGSSLWGIWWVGLIQQFGENWKNIFDLNTQAGSSVAARTIFNTYFPDGSLGETQVDANEREARAVEGWVQHVQNLRALSEELTGNPDAFDETFQINRDNLAYDAITATIPGNLVVTEDVVSKGWEFEFVARPTENWDITFNAAKIESKRQNWGDEAIVRYVELLNNDFTNTPAGDLRIYGGWVSAPTTKDLWDFEFVGNYISQKNQEGFPAPEVREWRFNLVTNYHFTDGLLNGINIGAGYRWQDEIVLGYAPRYTDETETEIEYDIANPFMGPSESNIDLWIGYYRRISDKYDLHVQLNVQNVNADEDLIPITVQPDGSPGAYRLGAARRWFVTATLSF